MDEDMAYVESIYDLRIDDSGINYNKSDASYKVLIAAVINRAILDGIGVTKLKRHDRVKGKKVVYWIPNYQRSDARLWFADPSSTLKYFCEMIGWHTETIRRLATQVFSDSDEGILKKSHFDDLI